MNTHSLSIKRQAAIHARRSRQAGASVGMSICLMHLTSHPDKLYNEQPPCLVATRHAKLNAAVAAYDWPADLKHRYIFEHLMALDLERRRTMQLGIEDTQSRYVNQ